MPFAVEAFLDKDSSKKITSVFDALALDGIAPFMKESGSRPHITLGVWEDLDQIEHTRGKLEDFAETHGPLPFLLYGLGIFTTEPAHVYASVFKTQILEKFQSDFFKGAQTIGGEYRSHYDPGVWVPHCTLATRCNRAEISRITEICTMHDLRFSGQIETIGLIEFSNSTSSGASQSVSRVKQLCEFSLNNF